MTRWSSLTLCLALALSSPLMLASCDRSDRTLSEPLLRREPTKENVVAYSDDMQNGRFDAFVPTGTSPTAPTKGTGTSRGAWSCTPVLQACCSWS